MNEITVKSKAKINIGLNIINKRLDGFHNLETIFYPIDLFDEIRFTKSDKFSFNSNDSELSKESTNLIIKAKEQLENYSGIQFPVEVYLNKNIPIGAGLGGGSSNAASTLIALNNLFDIKIELKGLAEISLNIGSDVPFFLNPVPAFAESRGEKIIPLNLSINKHIVVVNPGIHISTKWAFRLIKPKKPNKSLKLLVGKSETELDELMNSATNDFEKIVFDQFPEIKNIKENLVNRFGATFSMMTGTGSTIWGLFDEAENAIKSELFFQSMKYFTYSQKLT